jgi:hypothetical protein
MRTYHMSLNFVLHELPVIQGMALVAGAIATDPMITADIADGYVKTEIAKRRAAKLAALQA